MLWIVLGIAAALVVFAVALYNRLVQGRNRVRNAWAQIDVQLLRRSDLIPDLVESVRGYMRHEAAIFENIVAARRQAATAGADVPARAAAEAALSQQMRGLLALAEAVPELRASENMKTLQEELTTTENRIAYARQFFNDAVLDYNNRLATVPSNFVAGPFGFRPEVFFEAPTAAREKVKVTF
jgi:LemA protein